MKLLENKAAVVTGAGRGIGRGHCVHLARAGAAVVVNDIDSAQAQTVVKQIEDEGEVFEAIEDIWPDYPTKEDFFFNEDEY